MEGEQHPLATGNDRLSFPYFAATAIAGLIGGNKLIKWKGSRVHTGNTH